MLIPVASTLTETLTFGASLLLLAGIMAVSAIAPTAAVLWLRRVLAVTVVLAIALAYRPRSSACGFRICVRSSCPGCGPCSSSRRASSPCGRSRGTPTICCDSIP